LVGKPFITLPPGQQTIKEQISNTVKAVIAATGPVPDWELNTSKVSKAKKVKPASITIEL